MHGYVGRRDPNEQDVRREDMISPTLLPLVAACRFAASRFPFSPFSVIFTNEVRDKVVMDSLITHARNNHNFELKMVAHRRGRSDTSDCRILISVGNGESFAFLYDGNNWPTALAGCNFSTTQVEESCIYRTKSYEI